MKRGLLLTLTEPPPAMEEEFNAWYDTEHMSERLSIPGFRSAQRWVADNVGEMRPGYGKYLATYELDSAAVLTSREYLKYFENQSPWSRRCLGKLVVFKRWACEQVEPGAADPHPRAAALVMNAGVPGALQTRRFRAATGEIVTLAELAGPAAAAGVVYRLYRA